MNYKIPLFDLNYDQEEEAAVLETLRSKWISTGPKNAEFENEFAKQLSVGNAVALSNCTVSLHLALKILGIGEGDEVIVPSLTFVATANAVKYTGANPVFCDIKNLQEPVVDPLLLETLITEKTKAIIVMHYGGFSCNMNDIMNLSKKYNLKVVEDACHGPLSEYKGKKLGTIGDIGCFSFFSNKNMTTGEGGMLVTDNDEHAAKAKLLRSHGMTTLSYERAKGHSTSYDVIELGYNYRMDDIRASIGLVQLNKLKDDLEKRAEIRKYYIQKLSEIDSIIIPFENNNEFVSNYIFPLVLKDSDYENRERVRKELHEAGIQTSVHYPAVHLFSIYSSAKTKLPLTEYFSSNEITLPLYSKLTNEEIDFIVSTLAKILLQIPQKASL